MCKACQIVLRGIQRYGGATNKITAAKNTNQMPNSYVQQLMSLQLGLGLLWLVRIWGLGFRRLFVLAQMLTPSRHYS